MEHRAKIMEYYQTGRYECDYQVHLKLHQVAKELNLYEWLSLVEEQMQIVRKIKELTEINANSLDEDYDDEEGVCQTYKIRQLITQLNLKHVPELINQCQRLNWVSYTHKVRQLLSGYPEYTAIIQRIESTVHSDQLRVDSMIFTAFFHYVHGNRLNQLLNTYSSALEYYLNYLTGERKKFQFLLQNQEASNICISPKVRVYVATLYVILRVCLRFSDILKVLTGKNNLALKFTVVKKEIEKLIKHCPEIKQENDDLSRAVSLFKQHLKGQDFDKARICSWCLRTMKQEQGAHSFCLTLLHKKQLFK